MCAVMKKRCFSDMSLTPFALSPLFELEEHEGTRIDYNEVTHPFFTLKFTEVIQIFSSPPAKISRADDIISPPTFSPAASVPLPSEWETDDEEEVSCTPPGRELLRFRSSICEHVSCCEEMSIYHFHRGINPGYPKGYYCCLNVLHSSNASLCLRRVEGVDGGSGYGVEGVTGELLGFLPAEAASKIDSCINTHQSSGVSASTIALRVERFCCSRGCTRNGMQGVGYKPLSAVWGACGSLQ